MCDALCVALCQFRSLILPIKYLFINITVFMLCHVAKYSVHVAKYSVVKCLINVAKVQVLTIALQGYGRRSWRKTKKRMQQVHPLYSSPDLVAAPVESVFESGRAVLVAHVLCVKYS